MHPKEVDVRLLKLALIDIEVEVVLFKDGKHFIDYLSVTFQVFFVCFSLPWRCVHRHVVHVDGELPTGYLVVEQHVHHRLKGHR